MHSLRGFSVVLRQIFIYFYEVISAEQFTALKKQTLKHFWGHDTFRELQEEIIDTVISGRDALALLPTGGGKSLCYQLPALLLEGTCIIISPLLALMKDQVIQMRRQGVEAEYLSAELEDFMAEEIFARCKEGLTKLLYVSPERLTNRLFLDHLPEITVSMIAVDEAHCISEWGQDFRPSYQHIRAFREGLGNIPCLALTATATPKVLEEIKAKLGLRNAQTFQQSFQRSNIRIISNKTGDKYEQVLKILRYTQSSGIIYVRTRKETEQLTEFLNRNQLSHVDYFHAGLPAFEKNRKQKQWLSSNQHVLVATNAFGMGINKDNVRFIIHFSPAGSLENYYQEIGRAGRDGAESYAFLLWNEQELKNFDQILANQIPSKKEYTAIVSYLYSSFQVAEHDLPEELFQLQIQRIQKFTKCSLAKIRNVLSFLHHQELIHYDAQQALSSLELKIKTGEIDLLHRKDAYLVELLLRSLSGLSSGRRVLFSEKKLSEKLEADVLLVRERLRELQAKGYLEYIDGALSRIRFLKHREDRALNGKYWHLFEQIQKNKIRKWEEMKFFMENEDYCKMRMILTYFGEKNAGDCGTCSVCEQQKDTLVGKDVSAEILHVLKTAPADIEELSIKLSYFAKENILENLIYLLDSGKIKMLNFRTYCYNHDASF